MVEKERKKCKKQMEVRDPEERTEERTKKKSNTHHTQRGGDDGVTVAAEGMSSWKKKKTCNDRETEEGMDSGLSASAVDVSGVRVPVEAIKSKKKLKNRQTKLEEGAESRETVLRSADDPEIIELYTEGVEGGENVVTKVQNNKKENRKRKKEKVGEIQLSVCPDKTELPGILEQTGRKWKTTTRLKTQPDGGAEEGSRRNKRQCCRESDTGMDSVPSKSDNRTPDAGLESETGQDGLHTTMVETSTQHRRRIQNDKALSENEWRAMIELKEFVPNIASRPVNQIRAMIKYDLDRFKEFRRQGISLRTGRYSAQENRQLMSNINDFLALTGIENAAKLFHTKRFRDELCFIQRLKSCHRFPARIGEGIPRPWHKIYTRGGRKMFDGGSYKGRLGVMAYKMAHGQPAFSGGVKTLKAKVDLIKALNAMQVEDASDVDWEEIAHTIGGVTPCYVQMHYHKLKVAKVPLRQSMSFCETIDFLYSSVLPKFEELLRHSQTESGETESRETESREDPQEHFLLSEIFEDEDD
uniref:Uncharacterized protein n=1 Tax=Oncorhynchus tshawytscha TaxID=74940 RepID=A0AAZ3R0S8_ONCTS